MKTFTALLLSAGLAFADEVELNDGTIIAGKVQELGDSIRITKSGGAVTYPKSLVKRIEYKKTAEEAYAEKSKALKDGDLEGHLRLARWSAQQKLPGETRMEYQKVIALNPDHEEARAALGYRKLEDKWMTEDEVNAGKGLVKHKGRWITPEERDLDLALDEQKSLDRQLVQKMKTLLDSLRDDKKREESKAALGAIEDKYKTRPFLSGVTSSHREVRRFVIDELGRMKEPSAARPLARAAIHDEDEGVRSAALRALRDIRHPDTAVFLVPFLDAESTSARIRCEEALASFKDLRAVGPLIDALDSVLATLNVFEQYGEQMTVLVNRVVILRDGSRVLLPQVVRIKPESMDKEQRGRLLTEKSEIVGTLRAVTGQDFGESVPRWRAWLGAKKKAGARE